MAKLPPEASHALRWRQVSRPCEYLICCGARAFSTSCSPRTPRRSSAASSRAQTHGTMTALTAASARNLFSARGAYAGADRSYEAAGPAGPAAALARRSAVRKGVQAVAFEQDARRRPSAAPPAPMTFRPRFTPPTPARRSTNAPSVSPAGPSTLLRVAVEVPDCRLIFGEQLVLAGSCPELGGWDAAAAPRLAWTEGDTWVVLTRLPPGTHTFKLAVLRQDGIAYWEEGPDRELEVPDGAAAVAAAAGTGMRVVCRYGDWQPADITLATAAQLDALSLPTLAAAQPPAAGEQAGSGAPAAGQEQAPRPAASPSALERAARILEPTLRGDAVERPLQAA